jgi:hypothetical protein
MSKAKRGRPKGSRNKFTNEAKEAILLAFEGIGGVPRLIAWINKNDANETAFFLKLLPRLLPRPALDVVPGPEALPPIRGALTWRTPDWAKKARTKASYKSGVAAAAAAVAEAAGVAPPRQGDDGVPLGDWEDGP